VPGPQHRGGDGSRIDPVDTHLEGREHVDDAESHQALDGAGVVAQSEHEQCVRKNFSELGTNQHVSRKRVAEGRIALALSDSGDELGGVALDLLQVLSAERLPLERDQAGEPIRAPEQDREGAVGEV